VNLEKTSSPLDGNALLPQPGARKYVSSLIKHYKMEAAKVRGSRKKLSQPRTILKKMNVAHLNYPRPSVTRSHRCLIVDRIIFVRTLKLEKSCFSKRSDQGLQIEIKYYHTYHKYTGDTLGAVINGTTMRVTHPSASTTEEMGSPGHPCLSRTRPSGCAADSTRPARRERRGRRRLCTLLILTPLSAGQCHVFLARAQN